MLTQEVKNNIINALSKGELNNKVMTGDHVVSDTERDRFILPYDNTKRKIGNKLKRIVATTIVNQITKKINQTTTIVGLENIRHFPGPAIVTANHFSPVDSTIFRHFANAIGKKRKLSIVVAEANVFMPGKLGWLLKGVNTMPYALNLHYLEHNFNPALKKRLEQKHLILFYPEQEMWPGYTKPRKLQPGAYHYAAKHNVPIIPTFITMKKVDGIIYYTLNIFPLIYPDHDLPFKDRKTEMMNRDFYYKKNCYENFYHQELDYTYQESDLVY